MKKKNDNYKKWTQKDSECRLCDDRDETINRTISERSKGI